MLLFALFPGGVVPSDLRQVGSVFEDSHHCKNSFVREVLSHSNINADFIRGNLFVLSLDLTRLESMSLKDLSALNNSLGK